MHKYYKQAVPTIEVGKLILQEVKKLFPGPWIEHSLWSAQVAKLIAENCEDLDPEVAYILGVLREIGRRNGVTNVLTTIGHMLGGYKYS